MSAACFAYSKDRLRCDQNAGHDGAHTFTTYWTDDECFDPLVDSTVVWHERAAVIGQTTTERPVPIVGIFNTPAPEREEEAASGRCFTCNCTEAAHVPGEGCEPHACKTYLP